VSGNDEAVWYWLKLILFPGTRYRGEAGQGLEDKLGVGNSRASLCGGLQWPKFYRVAARLGGLNEPGEIIRQRTRPRVIR